MIEWRSAVKLVSAGNQQRQDFLYAFDGSITAGTTPQLVLARSMARSYLLLQNTSNGPLWFEIGFGRATASLTIYGTVSSVAVTNAGFNYTKPPLVRFLGGGLPSGTGQPPGGSTSYLGLNQPNGPAPAHPATGHAVLTGGAISSIVVDDPGAGYAVAPYVQIIGSDLDPYGCALPTATNGILVPSGSYKEWNGTCCPTDPVGVYGATTAQTFVIRMMD